MKCTLCSIEIVKVLLEIEGSKFPFMIQVLENFKYVKTLPLHEQEDIESLNLIRPGKKKARSDEAFIDELRNQNT